MGSVNCRAPVHLAALVDYWADDLSPAVRDALEEHVFACDDCRDRLDAIAELGRAIALLAARRGGMQMVLTQSLVDRLEAEGLRLRRYDAEPGAVVACTIGGEDDLLVTSLRADFGRIERVDFALFDAQNVALMVAEDVPLDAGSGRLIYTLSGDLARTFPAMTLRAELVAVEADGRRTIAEYTFEHTPFGS